MKIKDMLYNLLFVENYPITQSVAGGIGITRCGKTIQITVMNINNLPAGNTLITTLPVRFRPAHNALLLIDNPNKTVKARLTVNADNGRMELYNYGTAITSASNASGTLTYVGRNTQ